MSNRIIWENGDNMLTEDGANYWTWDSATAWAASDVTVTNITGTPINTASNRYTNVDEMVASDTDYVYSTNNTVGVFEILLDTIPDPINKTGHVISYRIANTNAGTLSGTAFCQVTAELYQGATLIKADTIKTTTAAWATSTLTLTNLEANAITNYADLRLRFTTTAVATRGVGISFASVKVPAYVAATQENLATDSELFNTGTWVSAAVTIANNVINTPSINGAFTGSSMTENGTTAAHQLRKTLRGYFLHLPICWSLYVKANGRTIVRIFFDTNAGGTTSVYLDTATGAINSVSADSAIWKDLAAYSIDMGGGWWFVSITAIKLDLVNPNAYSIAGLVTTGTTSNYAGDGVSGIYIAMGQINNGTVPYNYIKDPVSVNKKLALIGAG